MLLLVLPEQASIHFITDFTFEVFNFEVLLEPALELLLVVETDHLPDHERQLVLDLVDLGPDQRLLVEELPDAELVVVEFVLVTLEDLPLQLLDFLVVLLVVVADEVQLVDKDPIFVVEPVGSGLLLDLLQREIWLDE